MSEFHLPFNYYLSLFSSSLRTPLDLALAGQPLALYCTFSLDRSKPVILIVLGAGSIVRPSVRCLAGAIRWPGICPFHFLLSSDQIGSAMPLHPLMCTSRAGYIGWWYSGRELWPGHPKVRKAPALPGFPSRLSRL